MKLCHRPLVSIIVPSWNQGGFIRETIESILQQDYRPIEVLVIDGASTDGTVDILREFDGYPELNWCSEPDSGVVEAVNKGLRQACGEFAGIQSSDDCYLPGAISLAVNALVTDPSLGLVYGDSMRIDAEGRELGGTDLAPFSIEAFLAKSTWIPQPSAFFRLALAKELGCWREDFPYAPDTDLWLRMIFRSGALKLESVISKRRFHEEQRDKRGAQVVESYCRMIDESPEIRQAGWALRCAAAAGKYLTAWRYDTTGSEWQKSLLLFRAMLACPRQFRHHRLRLRWVLPGFVSTLKLLAWVKQKLIPGNGADLALGSAGASLAIGQEEQQPAGGDRSSGLQTGGATKNSLGHGGMSFADRLRVALRTWFFEFPRYVWNLTLLRRKRGRWIRIRNHGEKLVYNESKSGVRCDWKWGTSLNVCRRAPALGSRLMSAALAEWPMVFADRPADVSPSPVVSFILTHRGNDRLPLLKMTVRSLFGQSEPVECIVVQHAQSAEAHGLPESVQSIHLPYPDGSGLWNKAWAFNVGARSARGEILVFHDADICCPSSYAREIVKAVDDKSSEAAALHRFLFYLTDSATRAAVCSEQLPACYAPKLVVQNFEGGTIAIKRTGFFDIGGFDEGFVNWGGEDNEFFDRCKALRFNRYGYLPFVHLYHKEQAAKEAHNRNRPYLLKRLAICREDRIAELRQRDFGNPRGPCPAEPYVE